jgi:hypothetical protein
MKKKQYKRLKENMEAIGLTFLVFVVFGIPWLFGMIQIARMAMGG